MQYFDVPKIDLHCHLDGSVRPQTIIDLAAQQELEIPSQDIEVINNLMIAPESCKDLVEYIERFELPISVMQTEEALTRISYELFEDAAKENVKYLEVRFGPLLHVQQGLSLDQVIASVVKGMQLAQDEYDIQGNYILSILRTMDLDRVYEVIDAGLPYLGQGVVAFDLAGAELPGFSQTFVPHAQYAKAKGYRITIHAGEQGSGQNVFDAVHLLNAERVGHGIHMKDHADAYNLVKAQNVALETCPSSNVQTKAVESLASHPLRDFYQDDVLITINTDNRTVSNTTMTDEVAKVMQQFDLTEQDYHAIYRTSVEKSFASAEVKQQLLAYIS
ncbi:adenosine deaminase [Shewanella gelidii]|uniref:Adenosine deaminase n=1 Tax=Shewanella gelidii TaxID=1642821 RepID=A0A917JTY0_9GAMM|nr:adenosine deaminase [Shewanella gelidii]MCL1098648.1 adenosine deaminase [Shewanella gelidii]GGI86363.1 adenosine deaminase [Shewanella gelidii]